MVLCHCNLGTAPTSNSSHSPQHMKGMIPDTETGIIKTRVEDEEVNVTFVRVNNTASFIQQHIQHLSNTNQLVRYQNMLPNVLFIETQADKGKPCAIMLLLMER